MIHGGGWLIGDKGSKNVAENKVNYFVGKRGYVFVSINYRMEKDNIHPQELSDVSEAINSVYRNISKFGGDQNKIVVMGHSAGAHLAALVGTNNKYLSALGVPRDIIKGIIPLDGGGFDLPYLLRSEAMVKDMGVKKKDKLILERIRSTYNMAWGNYDQKTLVDASPISHLSKEDYPFLLIESSTNKPHVVLADNFQEELIRNGIAVDRKDFALKHEEINDFVGIEKHELTKEVEKFLLKVFE